MLLQDKLNWDVVNVPSVGTKMKKKCLFRFTRVRGRNKDVLSVPEF